MHLLQIVGDRPGDLILSRYRPQFCLITATFLPAKQKKRLQVRDSMAPLVARPGNCTMLTTRVSGINQVMVDLCSANLDKTLLSLQSSVLMFTLHLDFI